MKTQLQKTTNTLLQLQESRKRYSVHLRYLKHQKQPGGKVHLLKLLKLNLKKIDLSKNN